MHFSPALILAALPFLAVARLPLKHRQANPAYTLLAIHSGDQAVHNQPIVASNESFYIGADPTASCSSDSNAKCNAQTQVIFADSALVLNVNVAFGQQVFVDQNGALAYSPPNSLGFPPGAYETGFSKTTDPSGQASISNLVFNIIGNNSAPPGWLACPNELDGTVDYQIFANITGVQVSGTSITHCHDIAIALVPANSTTSVYQFN